MGKRDFKKRQVFGCKEQRGLLRLPLPETDAELEVITQAYFGVPLHLKNLWAGQYEVLESYDLYNAGKKFTKWDSCGYDHNRAFWNWICGNLYCNGVAQRSYGQFYMKSRGHRHQKRLSQWITNRRNGTNYLRRPFQRLAVRLGAQRERGDSR